MNEGIKNDTKDAQVVSFRNGTDFGFTPEMGCMFDGRAINGNQGGPGINAGESMILPYHVAHRLATNLAKIVKLRRAPSTDEQNDQKNPIGKPLWSDEDLEATKQSFLTEMYSEAKPVAVSETDRLMAKVEEYRQMVEKLIPPKPVEISVEAETPTLTEVNAPHVQDSLPSVQIPLKAPQSFSDKQDVIAELEKRNIKHDKRQNKATLEKLLG